MYLHSNPTREEAQNWLNFRLTKLSSIPAEKRVLHMVIAMSAIPLYYKVSVNTPNIINWRLPSDKQYTSLLIK